MLLLSSLFLKSGVKLALLLCYYVDRSPAQSILTYTFSLSFFVNQGRLCLVVAKMMKDTSVHMPWSVSFVETIFNFVLSVKFLFNEKY